MKEKPQGLNHFEASEGMESIKDAIEISPVIGEDEVVCIIKPDAFPWRDAIVRRLEEMGFLVTRRNTQQLTEPFIDEKIMSPDWSEAVKEATKRHFLGGPSEFLMVKSADVGGDAVAKLLDAVGGETNPALCDRDTIRFLYGDIEYEKLPGGSRYYRNAIHRPKDQEEAKKDKEKFGEIF